jgi:hypothetical protein
VPLIVIAILLVTVFVVEADTVIGKTIVVLPATAGAASVIEPLVSPATTILAII